MLEGLQAGDRLVVNGQFLLSAERGAQADDLAEPVAQAPGVMASHPLKGSH